MDMMLHGEGSVGDELGHVQITMTGATRVNFPGPQAVISHGLDVTTSTIIAFAYVSVSAGVVPLFTFPLSFATQ